MIKIAHVSDIHIGAFPRYERLRKKTLEVFREIVSLVERGSFELLLVSGDLFDLSHPSIEELREVAECFRRLKELRVPVCVISGSHDITATRTSILEVYEEAGLIYYLNPKKFLEIEDGFLKVKSLDFKDLNLSITGVPGLRRSLEIQFYSKGVRLEVEKPTIFMFHTAVSGVEDETYLETMPIDLLPKNENIVYYAGGHVHAPVKAVAPWSKALIVYPGAPVGRDFNDLKKTVLKLEEWEKKGYQRGFVRVDLDVENPEKSRVEWIPLTSTPSLEYEKFYFENSRIEDVIKTVNEWIEGLTLKKVEVAIVELTGSVKGDLSKSNVLAPIYKRAYEAGVTLHISSTLISKYQETILTPSQKTPLTDRDLFNALLGEDSELAYRLFQVLSEREPEGGRKRDYVERVLREAKEVLGLSSRIGEVRDESEKSGLLKFLKG